MLCAAMVLTSCTIGSASATQQPASSVQFLGHLGRWLTNSEGDVVVLHGMNMVYKRPPFTPEAAGFGDVAAKVLEDEGLDVVRLGVIYSAVEPSPGTFDRSYLDSIASTVSVLAHHGVYTLLDFHQDMMTQAFGGEGFPSWSVETDGLPEKSFVFPLAYTQSPALDAAFDNFWSDRPGPGGVGLQERYASAWRFVAERFAGDPYVLGYDLFNEPWPANSTASELAAFYSKVISSIRSVDKRHLIFYEPFVTFNFGVQTELPRITGDPLGMSFHDYCLQNSLQEEAQCAQQETSTVENALMRSAATGDALVLSEFGATTDQQDLGRVVAIADRSELPWIEWAYCGCEDPTGSIPPSIEALVYDPRLPAAGTNVDEATLHTLVEPYPRIVAGTPLSYGYVSKTHTFEITYSTTAPDGRHLDRGCSVIVVPALQYPNGYDVEVSGGRVVSSPRSGTLDVVAREGASAVTVRVTQGSDGSPSDPGPSVSCANG